MRRGLLKLEKIKKAYPDVDYTKLIPVGKIAELIVMWIKGNSQPDNGTFVEFKAEHGHVFPHYI